MSAQPIEAPDALCPCGSGKRYADCHGLPASARAEASPDRVGFVLAGTQKGGTSALAVYLREHPEICMATLKEVHFFDTDEFFHAENVDYSVYHRFFEPGPSHRLLGEATPSYMYWHSAPERIARYNPAMKIIMILRNPITRAFSHWNMQRQTRRDPLPFLDALKAEERRSGEVLPLQLKKFSYVGRGFYCEQIKRVWRYFPLAQTLILKSDELRSRPNAVLERIAAFLGIAAFGDAEPMTIHARDYEASMSAEEKRYLAGVFEGDIRELERLLGWDCADWLA